MCTHQKAGSAPETDTETDARIIVLLVRDLANNPPSRYHVPISGALDDSQKALGRTSSAASATTATSSTRRTTRCTRPSLLLWRLSVTRADTRSGGVHGGEQSNTSIIYGPGVPKRPSWPRSFRLVHTGENPDVTLQTALTSAGYRSVPRMLGFLSGTWSDPPTKQEEALERPPRLRPRIRQRRAPTAGKDSRSNRLRPGDDFLATGRAVLSRTNGERAHRPGRVHAPRARPTLGDIRRLSFAGWHQRLAVATSDVPELRELRPRSKRSTTRRRNAPGRSCSASTATYHLGQVLATRTRASGC